jgi:hypothetical protein
MNDTIRNLNPQNNGNSRINPTNGKLVARRLNLNSTERERWETFMEREGSVFASASWASLQCEGRDETLHFVVEDDEGICGACTIVNTRKFSNALSGYFVIQGNPVIRRALENGDTAVDLLFGAIEREARRRHVLCIEFEGLWSMWSDAGALRRHGYESRGIKGWILDLNGTEEEIYRRVAASHKNRKNQAEKKHSITIQDSDDVDVFFRLWQETYERAGKVLPDGTLAGLKRIYRDLAPSKNVRIRLATKDGQAVSGCFNLYYGETAYYWHGGSISGERYGASHLLHWSVIRESRAVYKRYHMGGSWVEYENETLLKQAEGVFTFKRLWGAEPHDFYWGRKVLRPSALRIWSSWLLPFGRKVKSLKLKMPGNRIPA